MRSASALAVLALLAASPADAAVDCTSRPDLCNRPAKSWIHEPDLALAIDIVFLSDFYKDGETALFEAEVDREIALLESAQGWAIVGKDPGLFNFHRVQVPLLPDGASPFGATGTFAGFNEASAWFAALQNAPDADVVVLFTHGGGRSSARYPTRHTSGGTIQLFVTEVPDDVLTHELGHALFGLADEYLEEGNCRRPSTEASMVDRPNVGASPESEKLHRAGRVTPVEGGYYCAEGVWRAAEDCMMRGSGDWCPACDREVGVQLQERRKGEDVDAPFAGFGVLPARNWGAPLDVTVAAWDSFAAPSWSLALDGAGVLEGSGREGSFHWDTATAAAGPHSFVLLATDPAGHETRVEATVVVDHTPDLVPPTVAFDPEPPTAARGYLQLRARAHDDRAVARVAFVVDGSPRTGTQDAAGWWFAWDTTKLAEGPHTLGLFAEDVGGNRTTAPDRTLVVANRPPTLQLTAPAAGEAVFGTVTLEARVSPGVTRVNFAVDHVWAGAETPVEGVATATWSTVGIAEGAHELEVRATDSLSQYTEATLAFQVRRPGADASLPGPDAARGLGADAGDAPAPSEGCGCGTRSPTPITGAVVLLLALGRRRPR